MVVSVATFFLVLVCTSDELYCDSVKRKIGWNMRGLFVGIATILPRALFWLDTKSLRREKSNIKGTSAAVVPYRGDDTLNRTKNTWLLTGKIWISTTLSVSRYFKLVAFSKLRLLKCFERTCTNLVKAAINRLCIEPRKIKNNLLINIIYQPSLDLWLALMENAQTSKQHVTRYLVHALRWRGYSNFTS